MIDVFVYCYKNSNDVDNNNYNGNKRYDDDDDDYGNNKMVKGNICSLTFSTSITFT